MKQGNYRYARCFASLIATLSLAACVNLSKVDGKGEAKSLVWPTADQATLPEGTYVDIRHLSMVQPGMTKDQLYDLLGRPHYQEGFYMVREWDYLFHVRTASGDEACQYKVLFDRHGIVHSLHWRTAGCETDFSNAMKLAGK